MDSFVVYIVHLLQLCTTQFIITTLTNNLKNERLNFNNQLIFFILNSDEFPIQCSRNLDIILYQLLILI